MGAPRWIHEIMAGNSRRRGAVRKAGTKKGPTVGSGGVRRRGLEGRGATPPAHMRPNHPAAKRAAKAQQQRRTSRKTDDTEIVLGRNPVLECLRAGVPATALYVALGAEADERLTESVKLAADKGISILEVPRHDLDRIAANGMHQGIALQVPPYQYAHPDDLLATATRDSTPALIVALDNISDPRNLGAIVRSVAAFGGHGVVIPQRRSASVTAVAWRTSAGAAARLPVARATNLNRTLKDWADRGPAGRRPGRGWRYRRRRARRQRSDGRGGRFGGQGAVPAGTGELRRGGVDPHGRADRVVERFGSSGRCVGRDRPPTQDLTVTARSRHRPRRQSPMCHQRSASCGSRP